MADIKKYQFIKNIKKIVKNTLQKLNLIPEIPLNLKEIKKENRRFYAIPCRKGKEKVFFKILLVKEKIAAKTLKREIEITKFLTKNFSSKKNLNFPLFLQANTKKLPYWFLHQYLPGPSIGYFYEIYPQGLKKENIKKIVKNLLSLQSIPVKKYHRHLSKIPLKERRFDDYLKMLKKRENFLKNFKNYLSFSKIYSFFKKQKKFFEKEKLVLAHGDFTLANFFFHKKNLYITDWEHAHIDNFAYDISHLWSQTWRYPKWRKKLVLYFLANIPKRKIENFQKIFQTVIITEALGELIISSEICPKKYKKDAKKAAKKTILAALKGFNQLINL